MPGRRRRARGGPRLVRYYGYSKCPGEREKKRSPKKKRRSLGSRRSSRLRPPVSKDLKKRWSYFIRKVYETDPLVCPKCSGEMRIIRFIDQPEVIRAATPITPPSAGSQGAKLKR